MFYVCYMQLDLKNRTTKRKFVQFDNKEYCQGQQITGKLRFRGNYNKIPIISVCNTPRQPSAEAEPTITYYIH